MKKLISILVLMSFLTFGFLTVKAQDQYKRVQPRLNQSICLYAICKDTKRSWQNRRRARKIAIVGTECTAPVIHLQGKKRNSWKYNRRHVLSLYAGRLRNYHHLGRR